MPLMAHSTGHVVHNGVAEHVLRRLDARDAAATAADDDGQLNFIVHSPATMAATGCPWSRIIASFIGNPLLGYYLRRSAASPSSFGRGSG